MFVVANQIFSKITPFKIYEVFHVSGKSIRIKDDSGKKVWYAMHYFMTLEEFRNNQINNLL